MKNGRYQTNILFSGVTLMELVQNKSYKNPSPNTFSRHGVITIKKSEEKKDSKKTVQGGRSGKCGNRVITVLTKDKPLFHLVPLRTTQTQTLGRNREDKQNKTHSKRAGKSPRNLGFRAHFAKVFRCAVKAMSTERKWLLGT
ncbi:hypothetical protein TNIN_129111 [Trichonephila inaurata madagascariensis]|uniref:Ribosomal protein L28 n=1 Tax=Trichonephila inaurata madagascariensis TaxID=2747483 RepID=A0A8X6YWM3_9ARAC|nr:hypothetical protein TNIN_129111 [Trichonephila inaurata madagascariensis]